MSGSGIPNPDVLSWAINEVGRLRRFSTDVVQNPPNSYATIGDLAPGAQFLARQAGSTSQFAVSAKGLLVSADNAWSHSHAMADLLEQWVFYVQAGMQDQAPFEVRARVEAANDLMDQVALLLDDRQIHPVAPMVLTGAAREERLRALMAEHA